MESTSESTPVIEDNSLDISNYTAKNDFFSMCVQTDVIKTKNQSSQYEDPYHKLKNKSVQTSTNTAEASTQMLNLLPIMVSASTQTEEEINDTCTSGIYLITS